MMNIVVSVDHKLWDDFRIVKLVNGIGNKPCSAHIVSGKKCISLKSIHNMMEFFGEFHPNKEINICLDGDKEEETARWLIDYFDE